MRDGVEELRSCDVGLISKDPPNGLRFEVRAIEGCSMSHMAAGRPMVRLNGQSNPAEM